MLRHGGTAESRKHKQEQEQEQAQEAKQALYGVYKSVLGEERERAEESVFCISVAKCASAEMRRAPFWEVQNDDCHHQTTNVNVVLRKDRNG